MLSHLKNYNSHTFHPSISELGGSIKVVKQKEETQMAGIEMDLEVDIPLDIKVAIQVDVEPDRLRYG